MKREFMVAADRMIVLLLSIFGAGGSVDIRRCRAGVGGRGARSMLSARTAAGDEGPAEVKCRFLTPMV